ncbi:hypothetical protein BS47DRAFT_1365080 [Hydnum rufescens UP504]|uniref:Uncharacterized protein n=1 Tax=Hydnum rufescens UP504 TaxID=1448309 RepID=A0A9P6APS5_9AGAM|nr:hypothetical protein BS47DRAFT_1365080 [Hydnum rufescens UP504]
MPAGDIGVVPLALIMPVATMTQWVTLQMPFLTKFHANHKDLVEELLDTSKWNLIQSILTSMMGMYFPAIAEKYCQCDEYWRCRTNGMVKAVSSLFFLITINASLSEHVKTWLHSDRKNIAVGICALFIFEQAWLVNLEANIVIQLPARVFFLFPSALITH